MIAFVVLCLMHSVWPSQEAYSSGAALRRELLCATAAGATVLGRVAPARADWQGEPVGVMKKHGPVILKLKDAVQGGELNVVSKNLKQFDLFAGGYYKNQPATAKEATGIIDKLSEAVEKKDVSGVKEQYDAFLTFTELPKIFSGPKTSSYHINNPNIYFRN